MIEGLGLIVIILGYWTANVVSLFATAVYIDPDEVETLFPNLSQGRKRFLTRLADDPRAFVQIATIYKSFILVGTTVAVLPALNLLIDTLGVPVAWVLSVGYLIVWLAYIVFVEYLPRKFSRQAISIGVVRRLWVIVVVYYLFYPVVRIYKLALERQTPATVVTEEDKEEIVERAIETLAEDAGIGEAIVEDDEKEMIGQIFQLDQTVVKEIMVPRPDITPFEKGISFREMRQIVLETGYSRYPVYDETIDKIIGLLYVKDLFNRMPEAGEVFTIEKYLRKPYFVPETKIIGALLSEFRGRRQHIAVVVDEYGGVAGLVTLEDIIEEIFGEIQDEHDTETAEIIKISDRTWRVLASLQVEKLQDELETDFDQGDYDTVGGLIYDLVGSVPTEGQRVKWHDVEFVVEKIDGQRILSVVVQY